MESVLILAVATLCAVNIVWLVLARMAGRRRLALAAAGMTGTAPGTASPAATPTAAPPGAAKPAATAAPAAPPARPPAPSLADLEKQVATLVGRLDEQRRSLDTLARTVQDFQASQASRLEELARLIGGGAARGAAAVAFPHDAEPVPAGETPVPQAGADAVPLASAAASAPAAAAPLDALKASVQARQEALDEEAAKLRAEALDAGRKTLEALGPKPVALARAIHAMLAALDGPAVADLKALAESCEPAQGLLAQAGEVREATAAFCDRLPDVARLENPTEFSGRLPDPEAEFRKAAEAEPGLGAADFERTFTAMADDQALQVLSTYRAALACTVPAVDAEAVEKDMSGLMPSLAVMLIEGAEEASAGADPALADWGGKHLAPLRQAVAAACGLKEVPVRAGGAFDPRWHKVAPGEEAPGETLDGKPVKVLRVLRPAYALASADTEPFRQATVVVGV